MQDDKIYERNGEIKIIISQDSNQSVNMLYWFGIVLELLSACLVAEVCQASKVLLMWKESLSVILEFIIKLIYAMVEWPFMFQKINVYTISTCFDIPDNDMFFLTGLSPTCNLLINTLLLFFLLFLSCLFFHIFYNLHPFFICQRV